MKHRWRVATYTVAGNPAAPLGTAFTRRGAERIERRHREVGRQMHGEKAPTGIFAPLPDRPLYEIRIERIT